MEHGGKFKVQASSHFASCYSPLSMTFHLFITSRCAYLKTKLRNPTPTFNTFCAIWYVLRKDAAILHNKVEEDLIP